MTIVPRLNAQTVIFLSKRTINSKKVRVEFSLEDMDLSGFQKDAAYKQIKAYVLEHSNLKVASLYISQIKRKCGLDAKQNYNLSKKKKCESATVHVRERSSNYGGTKAFCSTLVQRTWDNCLS